MQRNRFNNYLQIIEENKNHKLSVRVNNNSSYHRYLEMAHKQSEFHILTESSETGLTPLGEFFLASVLTLSLGLGGVVGGAVATSKIKENGNILNQIEQQIEQKGLTEKQKDEMVEAIYKQYKEKATGPALYNSETLKNILKSDEISNEQIIEEIEKSSKLKKMWEKFKTKISQSFDKSNQTN